MAGRPLFWVALAGVAYLLLTAYQLGLPGLHYDEAKEAGVNAVELLTGSPTTPFRNVAWEIGGVRLPLMVQDYIGALNVYLALPVLAVTGVGVPNLRLVGILTGLVGLFVVAHVVSAWERSAHPQGYRLTAAGALAAWMLALSPSFIFWCRQGIFVTNLIQPLSFLAIWLGLRWLATGRRRWLFATCFAAGLALYAKLLALWVVGPWLALLLWQWNQARRRGQAPRLDAPTLVGALLAGLIPLIPLIWFNLATLGTLQTLINRAAQSYYGVDNTALLANASVRLRQLALSLRGDHFWYLGGLYANLLAPWLAGAVVALGVWTAWRRMAIPLLLVVSAVIASCFTISDLFMTHYALILPVVIMTVTLAWALVWQQRREWRGALVLVAAVWMLLDLQTTLAYHGALTRSGGLADHSDAGYRLAYHLQANGLGAPIALDWGLDAPVRFLSGNSVRPVEIFGYASPDAPDAEFVARLTPFLDNPDNVYVLHAPAQTVFAGRREIFLAEVAARGQAVLLEQVFSQRDGTPVFEVWRLTPPTR